MPFATPEGLEVSVDAANINLQVAVLVEAEACARCLSFVILRDISVNGGLDSRPVQQ